MAESELEPLFTTRCEHGISEGSDCEQCIWEQSVMDDQATDEDYDDA